ncbi:PEF-CTERM sorting domain-containing protein [Methanosarcina siciliae]|uniref:PEF-CTERM sorting domain-containing protein n=1 Tax=Methanosarcina siciliae TaxID=38027 RepID=UPI00064E5AD7|nr:PEF-CTERM sorting domain-containing protein [Methanosarcina siciliae]
MKKISLFLVSIVLLLVVGAGNALAEDTLVTILNSKYGAGNFHEVTNTNEYEFQPGAYVVTALIVDKQSANVNPTGWYDSSDPDSMNLLFPTPEGSIGVSKSFNPGGKFGMYIEPSAGTTYYSKASLNGGVKRVRLFTLDTGGYVLGFEDSTDNDYQDVVLELKGASLNVPEFPTIAAPIAAILGLVFIFGRKKEGL